MRLEAAGTYQEDGMNECPICGACDGKKKCAQCGGKGKFKILGANQPWTTCQACGGTGTCGTCGGTGIVNPVSPRVKQIKMPKFWR